MMTRHRSTASSAALSLILALLQQSCVRSQERCDPCAATNSPTFKVRPGTSCKEYVQCINGVIDSEFTCSGDTIYDESKQYCNWPSDTVCIETTCPPTRQPSTGQPTGDWEDCTNPCPRGFSGFRTRPGTQCKRYVQCENGVLMEELECFGETLFNEENRYCDWPDSYTCGAVSCPERLPTELPTQSPAATVPVNVPDQPVLIVESADCPNPCPADFTGFKTRPGWQCKKYVQCENGDLTDELECVGDTVFNPTAQYCDWSSSTSCTATPCPEQREPTPDQVVELTPKPTFSPVSSVVVVVEPVTGAPVASIPGPTPFPVPTEEPTTSAPVAVIEIEAPEIPVITIPVTESDPPTESFGDCPNPCLMDYSGLRTKPESNCTLYVQCEDGDAIAEFECNEGSYFVEESGVCQTVNLTLGDEWVCPPVPCPGLASPVPTPLPVYSPETVTVDDPPPTQRPTPMPRTRNPSTPRPTPMPAPTYQSFRAFLDEREEKFNSVILQSSNGRPSTAYTFSDFVSGLDIAVFQLPADKSFFVGEGMDGRLPKLTGAEYGLVNLAAFLSNAMEEGIRFDSCDEWNTDFMYDGLREKYPLSNACGQYGRSYEDEMCPGNEPYQCAGDSTLEVTAVDGNTEKNVPPFTCRPKEYDGLQEIFPGYYDSVDDVVKESAYANSLGRTDVEGCCWWGRGVLLTRGLCAIGKLNKYLGQGAIDRGVYVYPDINFCLTPEAICNHPRTNELRWVLGLLEWSDRVQSYADVDSGWDYMDQLKRFVDEGMTDDAFIDAVINIFTRKCHDNSCEDQWVLDEDNNIFEEVRRDNFRKIIFEVFNLPMTYRPTDSPTVSPTWPPTFAPSMTHRPSASPTDAPTAKPTKRRNNKPGGGKPKDKVAALPPNSGQWTTYNLLALLGMAYFGFATLN